MSTTRTREAGFDFETKYKVINSPYRRKLIALVSERDQMSLTEASEAIAAEKADKDPEDIEYEDRHPVYTQLSQTHVPKLTENDVVAEIDNVLFATEVTHDFAYLIRVLDEYEIGGASA